MHAEPVTRLGQGLIAARTSAVLESVVRPPVFPNIRSFMVIIRTGRTLLLLSSRPDFRPGGARAIQQRLGGYLRDVDIVWGRAQEAW